MDDRFNTLAEQLFQKPLEQCSPEEIKRLTDQYPYYAPAQYLLLKRLQPGTDEYDRQYQKATLYYHNPLHFAEFLNPQPFDEDLWVTEAEPVIEEPTRQEPPEAPVPEPSPITQVEEEPAVEASAASEPVTPPPVEEPTPQQSILARAESEPLGGLTFEPYHTVDYFASQGIKLSQEELPKDQLGKQMKSFTEWLKTMKRLPASELVKAVDSQAERKIENLAEHSLKSADIVTEAMAEVWARQGNIQKALEVYNKLSLQNPSKKAYFAAKIDNLKKSH